MHFTKIFVKSWLALIVVVTFFAIYYGLIRGASVVSPRKFIERDPDLSLPLVETPQVPASTLWALSIGIPGATLLCIWIIMSVINKEYYVSTASSIKLGAVLAITLLATSAITWTLKILFGAPRPSFFAICNYQHYNDAVISGNFTQYNELTTAGVFGSTANCFASKSDIDDAFSSFPSGHASLIFSAMTYFVFNLITIFDIVRKIVANPYWYSVLSLIKYSMHFGAYVLASWVAITRVQDNKHHTYDVFAGSVLGIFVACVVNMFSIEIFRNEVACTLTDEEHKQNVVQNSRSGNGNTRIFGKVFGLDWDFSS